MYRRACLLIAEKPEISTVRFSDQGFAHFPPLNLRNFVMQFGERWRENEALPLRLVLLKDLSLGVVANGASLDEAAQVELLGPEHGHDGQRCGSSSIDEGLTLKSRASAQSLMMPGRAAFSRRIADSCSATISIKLRPPVGDSRNGQHHVMPCWKKKQLLQSNH